VQQRQVDDAPPRVLRGRERAARRAAGQAPPKVRGEQHERDLQGVEEHARARGRARGVEAARVEDLHGAEHGRPRGGGRRVGERLAAVAAKGVVAAAAVGAVVVVCVCVFVCVCFEGFEGAEILSESR
jgi:hypothetical protein